MSQVLPHLSNGKVNVHALPEPEWSATAAEEEATVPSSSLEGRLLELFKQALGAYMA